MSARCQFVIDVLHPSRPIVSKDDVSEKIAAMYMTDEPRVVTFGFRTAFCSGIAMIYDDEASQKKFEPKYRLLRVSGPPRCNMDLRSRNQSREGVP